MPQRGGASDQPPVRGERIQQGAATREEAAGGGGRLPGADALQPHLSGRKPATSWIL